MISSDNEEQLYRFARKCLHIKSKLSLSTRTLTPLNFHVEKEKFFKSKTYNPYFEYKSNNPVNYDEIFKLESELDYLPVHKEVKAHLSEYITDLKLLAHTYQSIGSYEFSYYARKLYVNELEKISETLQDVKKLTILPDTDKTLYNADQIAEEFRKVLCNRYKVDDFPIVLDTYNDHTVRVGTKRVVIGNRVKRYKRNVKRLIVHEVETHALQGYNIRNTKSPLVKLVKHAESQIFAEGMAVYNEHITKTLTPEAFDVYYYRLKAVQMLNLSFREIFEYLSSFVNPYKAFLITARVKRGMGETAKPGGFPKDAGYFLGFKRIKDYIKNGSNLSFLYISKVPSLSSLLLRHNLLHAEDVILPHFLLDRYNVKYELNNSLGKSVFG